MAVAVFGTIRWDPIGARITILLFLKLFNFHFHWTYGIQPVPEETV